jgi:acetyl-CoA acetyltransferase
MNALLKYDLCYCSAVAAGAAALLPAFAARADDAAGVASSRMSYSRFLEYLEMGRVKKVSKLRF